MKRKILIAILLVLTCVLCASFVSCDDTPPIEGGGLNRIQPANVKYASSSMCPEDSEPATYFFRSKQELLDYYNDHIANCPMPPEYGALKEEEIDEYTDEFFTTHDLVVYFTIVGSGMIRHKVNYYQVSEYSETVEIVVDITTIEPDGFMTCDMKNWHIFVPVEKIDGSLNVEVVVNNK